MNPGFRQGRVATALAALLCLRARPTRARASRERRAAALAALLCLYAAGPAAAQTQMQATAELVVAAPTGAGHRDLSFGVVTMQPGLATIVQVPAAIAPISASVHSGEFRLNVSTTRGVTLEVGTPAALYSASGAAMAVSYSGTQYGAWCVNTGSGCSLTSFDPAGTASLRICRTTVGSGNCHPARTFPANSILHVFIGGALTVAPGQRAGVYTGTITLTITQVH
jgi:hypothetical protein